MPKELTAGGQMVALLVDTKKAPRGMHPITGPKEALQLLVGNQPVGQEIKKHRHKKMRRLTTVRQKAVVVISGAIGATVCNDRGVDGDSCTIKAGQCLLLLRGGYRLKMKKGSRFFEFKNGPHLEDKVML